MGWNAFPADERGAPTRAPPTGTRKQPSPRHHREGATQSRGETRARRSRHGVAGYYVTWWCWAAESEGDAACQTYGCGSQAGYTHLVVITANNQEHIAAAAAAALCLVPPRAARVAGTEAASRGRKCRL